MYIIDERTSIQAYFVLIKRRWFSLLSFVVIFMIVSFVISFKQTPIYEAKSKIRIEYKSPKVVATQEAFSGTHEDRGAYENYFKTQLDLLKSKTFLTISLTLFPSA